MDIVDATATEWKVLVTKIRIITRLFKLNRYQNTFVFNELSSIVEKFNDLQKTYNGEQIFHT